MSRLALLLSALLLAGCGEAPRRSVSDGYVRLPAVPGRPAAAYFTIQAGATDARLLSISSSVAIRTEMHESMSASGLAGSEQAVMRMRPLNDIAIPAGAHIRFAPGGRHAMLFNINPGIKPGRTVPFLFSFADGTRIPYAARAIAAGAPVPE